MTEPITANTASLYGSHSISGDIAYGDNRELLTAPLGGQFDNISAMYVLITTDARTDTQATMVDIQRANEERADAWERQLQAMAEARQAEDDGGFWGGLGKAFGTVAKVAGCVAAVALAVASGGAGAPILALAIAGAVCSSASLLQSELNLLGEMGVPNADDWGTGFGVAGAICTGGVGLMSFFGVGAGAASESLVSEIAARTAPVAAVVGGLGAVGYGVTRIGQGVYASEAEHHRADATQAMIDAQFQQMLLAQLLTDFEETKERETSNVERIVAMNNLECAALTAAATGVA